MEYIIHRQVQREGKYEITYSVYDGLKVVIGNVIRSIGKEELDEKQLSTLFADKIFPEMEASQSETNEPERTMTITEVEDLLKEKGLLSIDEKLEDLKTIAEIEAVVAEEKVVEVVK